MEKTEAESVDAIVDASNKEVNRPIPADAIVIPKIHQIITPVIIAVKNTPIVASTTPCAIIGRISDIFVSNPPEKSMIHKAIVPTFCAI